MFPHPTMSWIRRRLRHLAALRWAGFALLIAVPAAILAAAALRGSAGIDLPAWWPLAAPAAAALAYAAAWSLRRPTDLEAAIALDRRLGLDERVSTAAAVWTAPPPPDVNEVLARAAFERLSACDRKRLAAAFPAPRPGRALALLAMLLLAAWCVPMIPAPGADPAKDSAADAARKRREAQQVREAARKLEKRADQAARALTRQGSESARSFARKAAAEAKDLAARAHGRTDALARLSKLSDAIAKARSADLAQAGDPKAFGQRDPGEDLAALAGAAAGVDLPGLDRDLGRLAAALEAEAKAAAAGNRGASVDHQKLEDLERRLAAAQELARRIAELLAKNPELRKKLEAALKRQQAKLAKAREGLKRLGGA